MKLLHFNKKGDTKIRLCCNSRLKEWPRPAGRNVFMMPFAVGEQNSLPEHLQCYWAIIQKTQEESAYQKVEEDSSSSRLITDISQPPGTVWYLTVIETFGKASNLGGMQCFADSHLKETGLFDSKYDGQEIQRTMTGGVYLASYSTRCTLYDCVVENAQNDLNYLADSIRLKSSTASKKTTQTGELWWCSALIPHEWRTRPYQAQQILQIVTEVSQWDARVSTPNPQGVVPPPEVKILR
jgi:hypothetical protein